MTTSPNGSPSYLRMFLHYHRWMRRSGSWIRPDIGSLALSRVMGCRPGDNSRARYRSAISTAVMAEAGQKYFDVSSLPIRTSLLK